MCTFRSVTWQVNGSVLPEGVGDGSRRGMMFGVGVAGPGVERAGAHPLTIRINSKFKIRSLIVFFTRKCHCEGVLCPKQSLLTSTYSPSHMCKSFVDHDSRFRKQKTPPSVGEFCTGQVDRSVQDSFIRFLQRLPERSESNAGYRFLRPDG